MDNFWNVLTLTWVRKEQDHLLGFSSSVIEGSFLGEGLHLLHPVARTLWKVASSERRYFCSEFVTHGT